jgi:putative NADH-flavin reductase
MIAPEHDMKVSLFGATGLTGRQVLAQALQRGHEVTALVRRPEALQLDHARLHLIQGDALDPDAVTRAIRGQDAVLQCLGIGGKGDGKPSTFVSDATRVIVEAMQATGVQRLVCMSNAGAGDSAGFGPWIYRAFILPTFMKWLVAILEDKNRMEPLVQQSGLAWTLARFPAILDKRGKGHIRESYDGRNLGFTITTGDTAAYLLDQLESDKNIGKAPLVSN